MLVLATAWEDASRWDPPSVIRFLVSLNVPLRVWYLGEDASIAAPWAEAEPMANYRDLSRAVRDLEKDLDRQRIVWLEGSHLPNLIQISEIARAQAVFTRP